MIVICTEGTGGLYQNITLETHTLKRKEKGAEVLNAKPFHPTCFQLQRRRASRQTVRVPATQRWRFSPVHEEEEDKHLGEALEMRVTRSVQQRENVVLGSFIYCWKEKKKKPTVFVYYSNQFWILIKHYLLQSALTFDLFFPNTARVSLSHLLSFFALSATQLASLTLGRCPRSP